MNTARTDHAAAQLLDGRVLVVGGIDGTTLTRSSELFNQATGTWEAAADVPIDIYKAAAATLPDGTVLVAGGTSGVSELYDPATNTWSAGQTTAISGQTFAATLPNGNIFFLGSGAVAQTYNPTSGSWTTLATSPTMRNSSHFSARDTAQLPNGDIVTLRAMQYAGAMPATPTSGPAVYHWASNTWTLLPTPPVNPGDLHVTLAALSTGNVMLADGAINYLWFPSSVQTVMEVNPTTGKWTTAANSVGSTVVDGELVGLPNGSILATGGVLAADMDYVYSPTTHAWSEVAGRNVDDATLTALADGTLLATGGIASKYYTASSYPSLSQADIFTP